MGNTTDLVPYIPNLIDNLIIRRWRHFYINGEKYLVFLFQGKLFFLTEFQVCFILFNFAYFGTFGIRLLLDRIKPRTKIQSLVKKLRGGGDYFVGDEEGKVRKLLALKNIKFSPNNELIYTIAEKCFKPFSAYEITNPGLITIITKMVDFSNSENVRKVNLEVIILALTHIIKSSVLYAPVANAPIRTIRTMILANLPYILSIGGGVASMLLVPIQNLQMFQVVLINYLTSISLRFGGTYKLGKFLRHKFIDCTMYRQELAYVLEGKTATLPSDRTPSYKLFYTREKPTRNKIYLLPDSNDTLYYQLDLAQPFKNLKTLNGDLKSIPNVKGESNFTWVEETGKKITSSKYIPLKGRTRTLPDLQRLDSTVDRKLAQDIGKRIKTAKKAIKIRATDL